MGRLKRSDEARRVYCPLVWAEATVKLWPPTPALIQWAFCRHCGSSNVLVVDSITGFQWLNESGLIVEPPKPPVHMPRRGTSDVGVLLAYTVLVDSDMSLLDCQKVDGHIS